MKDWITLILEWITSLVSKGRTRLVVALAGIVADTAISYFVEGTYKWLSLVCVTAIALIYIIFKTVTDLKNEHIQEDI